MTKSSRLLILGCSALALAGCGADEIVSPGTTGDTNVVINNPAPTPAPGPTPGPTVQPAAGCPTINSTGGLTDGGTIDGPTGTYRVCELPARIDADDTLPYLEGLLYAIPGRVDVGTDQGATSTGYDVQLTVEPGVVLFGGTGAQPNGRSFLVVNRGNQLFANGTQTRPIVFTSRDNVLGLSTDASIGQWGGVVMLGRAPVSDCRDGGPNPADQANCEQALEGTALTTVFGGAQAADKSGELTYVQIRYSGFALAPGNELQSLTTGGTGSGTVFNNIQTFNSSDDGMEFFGGTVNMKRIVVVGADDDSIDADTGVQANLQYALVAQRSAGGDSLIEFDSPASSYSTDARPQSVLKLSNFTFLERSTANGAVVRARGGAKLILANGVISTADSDRETCVRVDEAVTLAAGPEFYSIAANCDPARPFQGSEGVSDGQVQERFAAGSNNNADFTLTLAGFINGTNENGVAVYDPTQLSSYFDSVNYIGAVRDANDTWYRDWTCNSATLDLGSANGSCTRLPVY